MSFPFNNNSGVCRKGFKKKKLSFIYEPGSFHFPESRVIFLESKVYSDKYKLPYDEKLIYLPFLHYLSLIEF
jgi:hypothetical protein